MPVPLLVTYSIMSHTQILSLHVEIVTINLLELGILTNKSNLTECCGSTKSWNIITVMLIQLKANQILPLDHPKLPHLKELKSKQEGSDTFCTAPQFGLLSVCPSKMYRVENKTVFRRNLTFHCVVLETLSMSVQNRWKLTGARQYPRALETH